MNINIGVAEIQAFVAVAEKLSFKAAADCVFISQPALSRRIDKLEDSLGTRLLFRTTRRVTLTDAGQQFLVHAQAALESLEAGLQGVNDHVQRRSALVTVSCVPSAAFYLLPAYIKRFADVHTGTRVRLMDESAGAVLASVMSGVADFGINFVGTQEPDIDFQAIYQEKYVLAMQKDHPLASRTRVLWEDLAGERFISAGKGSGNRLLIDQALGQLPQRPTVQFEASHIAGVLGMVAAGLGVAAVPALALSPKGHPGLACVPLAEPVVSRTLGLISLKGKVLHPQAAALYDLLKGTALA